MAKKNRNYRPPTVESDTGKDDRPHIAASFCDQGTQTLPDNEPWESGCQQESTPKVDLVNVETLSQPTSFSDKATQTAMLRTPIRGILRKVVATGATAASTKRVTFGETPASDITTGEFVPPSSRTGPEYRAKRRSELQEELRGSWKRRKRWHSTARRLAEQAMAEKEARALGGDRRVLWRRGMMVYLRKNGMNGNLDALGRFRKHDDDDGGDNNDNNNNDDTDDGSDNGNDGDDQLPNSRRKFLKQAE
ncbi:hypothetical protein SCUP234_03998 [Seiridium cupressi]